MYAHLHRIKSYTCVRMFIFFSIVSSSIAQSRIYLFLSISMYTDMFMETLQDGILASL